MIAEIAAPHPRGEDPIRIGILRLTDAAPVLMAQSLGLFAEHGLTVEVVVEPSWANLADKLAYGLIDAAVMVPPLALAQTVGLRQPTVPLMIPLTLSSGGNALTLSRDLATALHQAAPGGAVPSLEPLAIGLALRRVIDRLQDEGTRPRPTLAVVHAFSTHNLLLRYWLAGCGIAPERDVAIAVVPPADMAAALAINRIDGFIAGAPWGAVAAHDGAGETVLLSSQIWQGHPEKCLAVRSAWGDGEPERLHALLQALLLACRHCDDPANTAATAALLTGPLGVPSDFISASLPGGWRSGGVNSVDASRFTHTRPARASALWLLRQMGRWREMPPDPVLEDCAATTYRPDLHDAAVAALGWPARADAPLVSDDFFDHGRSQPWP